nr:uridine diphosphate-glycosyltransferases 48G1 [Glyphodes pyloalis]
MLSSAICLCLVHVSVASRILVVFPVPDQSHSVLGDAVVKTLLQDHHEVTYLSVYPKKTSNQNLTYIDISSVIGGRNGVSTRSANDILRAGPRIAQDALQHEGFRELLLDPAATFDAVIADWYYSGLLAPLAALYECPLIWYTSGDVSWRTLKLMHEEPSPAYSVDMLSGSLPSSPFTTKDRLYQLGMQIYLNFWAYYTTHFEEIPAYDVIYRTPFQLRKRLLPPFEDLVYNGSLLLVNSHPPLAQALPLPLNAKHVGGHHIGQVSKPLPETLQTSLDNAKHGVIFISLGADIERRMNKKQQEHLLDALARLEQVVLYQVEEAIEYVPRNIRILKKAPRLSILNHPKTKLFITDGSLSSLMEATHNEIPIIAVPTAVDQNVNVDLMVSRGLGLRVDFTQYFPWHVEGAAKEILGNYSFKSNAEHASLIFQRRITAPNSDLLHWVNLVISTRGAAHLRSPALQVPALERYHADLWILVFLAIWFLSKVLKVIQVHLKEDLDKKNQ